jgi:hypothetical protein
MIPRSFYSNGRRFDRVSIVFVQSRFALQARALVHDALIRTHGFKTAHHLTCRLVEARRVFRVGVAHNKIGGLKRRLRLLIEAGIIKLFVAGRRVCAPK